MSKENKNDTNESSKSTSKEPSESASDKSLNSKELSNINENKSAQEKKETKKRSSRGRAASSKKTQPANSSISSKAHHSEVNAPMQVIPEFFKGSFDRYDDDDNEEANSNIDVSKILAGIKRHVLLILIMGCFGVFSVVGINYILSKQYTSQVFLLFKNETPKELTKHYTLNRLTMPTMLAMMNMPLHVKSVKSILGLNLKNKELKEMFEVIPPNGNSNLIKVVTNGKDPNLVLDVCNTFASVVVKHSEDYTRRQLQTAYDYFSTQLDIDRQQYMQQNREISEFRKKYPYFEVNSGSSLAIERASNARENFQTALLKYNSQLVEYENLKREVGQVPEHVVKYAYEDNPIKSQIAETEMALLHARTRYASDNPKIKVLQSTIAELQSLMGDTSVEETKNKIYEKNPYKETLDIELMRLRGKLRSSQKLKEDLNRLFVDTQKELDTLPEEQMQFAKMVQKNRSIENEISELEETVNATELLLRLGDGDLEVYQTADAAEPLSRRWDKYVDFLPLIGFGIGIIFGVFLSSLLEIIDRRICTKKQLSGLFDIPCWQLIPEISKLKKKDAEIETLFYIREIAERIEHCSLSKKMDTQTICLLSSMSGEGKSLLLFNLALYFKKRLNQKVVYISLDYRDNPQLKSSLNSKVSFDSFLEVNIPLEDVIVKDVVDHININFNPSIKELIKSDRMKEVWLELKEKYDLILVDAPSVIEDDIAPNIALMSDINIFVVGSTVVVKNQVASAITELQGLGVTIDGILLNKIEPIYIDDVRVSTQKIRRKNEKRFSKS